MRKIEDLKENECIRVINKKEAHKILDIINMCNKYKDGEFIKDCINKMSFKNRNGYISITEKNHVCITVMPTEPYEIIYPASDFLPNKKSLKKRIKSLEAKVDTMLAKDCVVSEAEQVKEIDWSKSGQLVSSEKQIVMTTGKHTDMCFTGIKIANINEGNSVKVGDYDDYYVKCMFKIHNAPITLCNEK